MRIDPVSPIITTTLAADYRLQIDFDAASFNDVPGGRIDTYHYSDGGADEDSWFVCASQEFAGPPPPVNLVQLYYFKVTDKSYTESKLHAYNNWAKCAGTYAISQTEAIFLILETRESGPPRSDGPYLKILQIDYDTGDFSFKMQD